MRCQAGGWKPAPLLSEGTHQKRTIMYNYNWQSKTKPFTYNEFLLEKGRLPQGGILMKQMAECSQGQTQTVLLFRVCQHFQHFEGLHLSLDRSLCASEWMTVKNISQACTTKKTNKLLTFSISCNTQIKMLSERSEEVCMYHTYFTHFTICDFNRRKKEKKTDKKRLEASIPYDLFCTILFHPVYVLIDSLLLLLSHIRPTTATVCLWLLCGSPQCPTITH